jgi:hypothetical protein
MKSWHFHVIRWICMSVVVAGFVMGCATPPPPQTATVSAWPSEFPQARYRQAEALGKKVLKISPELSVITIEVRRAGSLARLGHDHIVASHDIHGYVMPEEGLTDLFVPLARLAVDESGLRAEAKLDTQPTPEAIEGTRNNMLTKVLEVDRFPFALIHASRIDPASSILRISISLHGVTRSYDVPVRIGLLKTGISVDGSMSFSQTEFGITPFSILGGAIQVQDQMKMRFHIEAHEN